MKKFLYLIKLSRKVRVLTIAMFILKFLLIMATSTNVFAEDVDDLMSAIETGNKSLVKGFLQYVPINSVDKYGQNVLHVAAIYLRGEIMRLLLSNGAEKLVNDEHKSPYGPSFTPLMMACAVQDTGDQYEVLEALLKAGADPNILCAETQNAPLCTMQQEKGARLLISYGANVNARNILGYTVAHLCVIYKLYDVLYALVDGNADFAITDISGSTIFHFFSPDRHNEVATKKVIRFLAQNGAPLEALDGFGETPLTDFMKQDDTFHLSKGDRFYEYEYMSNSFYSYMAEAGANLSTKNQNGESLLHISALKYYEGAVKWLLDNGVETEVKNAAGDTPLLALVKHDKWNRFNYEGMPPFLPRHEEIDKVRAVIDVLVDGGVNIEAVDEDGHNAFHYVEERRLIGLDWYIGMLMKKNKLVGCTGKGLKML